MLVPILLILVIYSLIKAFQWKIHYLATLYYYVERGIETPDRETNLKYCEKVIKKMMHIK